MKITYNRRKDELGTITSYTMTYLNEYGQKVSINSKTPFDYEEDFYEEEQTYYTWREKLLGYMVVFGAPVALIVGNNIWGMLTTM